MKIELIQHLNNKNEIQLNGLFNEIIEFGEFNSIIFNDSKKAIIETIKTIPVFGMIVGTTWQIYNDRKEKLQLCKLLLGFCEQFSKIDKNKIDYDYLKTDEFYLLFKKVLEKVRLESREDKIKLFRNFILNSTKNSEKFKKVDKRYLLDKLDLLNLDNMKILKWYKDNNYDHIQETYQYSHKRTEMLKEFVFAGELENDLVVAGFLSDNSAGRLGGGKYFVLTSLGKIFYDFIQHDEI
ncbi:MAG: hypothetical protein WC915_03660 [archaeon]|jgi:hypothetical protein